MASRISRPCVKNEVAPDNGSLGAFLETYDQSVWCNEPS